MKKIERDKWKHFFVGIGMGAVLQAFTSYLLKNHPVSSTIIAFILVMVVSYGFELYSKFTGIGHYDIMDAVAGAIGGILGMGLLWLTMAYLF